MHREGILGGTGQLDLRVIRRRGGEKSPQAPLENSCRMQNAEVKHWSSFCIHPGPRGIGDRLQDVKTLHRSSFCIHPYVPGPTLREIIELGFPQRGMPKGLWAWKRENLPHLWRGLKKVLLARIFDLPHFYGRLDLAVIRANGRIETLGLVSFRVVTNNGVALIIDEMDAATSAGVALDSFKYHGIGTGITAEAAADSALVTELTTQYNPDNTRATGNQSQPASNQYQTVGTNTVDAAVAATEHGIFTQAATGGGTLLDRSVFSVINLANGDGLQSTYTFTASAGG